MAGKQSEVKAKAWPTHIQVLQRIIPLDGNDTGGLQQSAAMPGSALWKSQLILSWDRQ